MSAEPIIAAARCCVMVMSAPDWKERPCSRPVAVTIDGRGYCTQDAPPQIEEIPRCTSHVWRERIVHEFDGSREYRTCAKCRISYDEIEAELHDATCENATLRADLNAETERADANRLLSEHWREEAQRERVRAEQNELAARLNAHTANEARIAHAAEVSRYEREAASLRREIVNLRDDLARVARERTQLQRVTREQRALVVETRDHGPRTVWAIYEQPSLHRDLCSVCGDEACGGCPPSEAEMRYEHDAEVC